MFFEFNNEANQAELVYLPPRLNRDWFVSSALPCFINENTAASHVLEAHANLFQSSQVAVRVKNTINVTLNSSLKGKAVRAFWIENVFREISSSRMFFALRAKLRSRRAFIFQWAKGKTVNMNKLFNLTFNHFHSAEDKLNFRSRQKHSHPHLPLTLDFDFERKTFAISRKFSNLIICLSRFLLV